MTMEQAVKKLGDFGLALAYDSSNRTYFVIDYLNEDEIDLNYSDWLHLVNKVLSDYA